MKLSRAHVLNKPQSAGLGPSMQLLCKEGQQGEQTKRGVDDKIFPGVQCPPVLHRCPLPESPQAVVQPLCPSSFCGQAASAGLSSGVQARVSSCQVEHAGMLTSATLPACLRCARSSASDCPCCRSRSSPATASSFCKASTGSQKSE